jgi:hypothetical protein
MPRIDDFLVSEKHLSENPRKFKDFVPEILPEKGKYVRLLEAKLATSAVELKMQRPTNVGLEVSKFAWNETQLLIDLNYRECYIFPRCIQNEEMRLASIFAVG